MKVQSVCRCFVSIWLGLLGLGFAGRVSAAADGIGPFSGSDLAQTGSLLRDEAVRSRRAASLWGLWGGVSIGYLVWEGVDTGQGSALMSCVSYVGIAAGALGFARDLSREKRLVNLDRRLSSEIAATQGPPYLLSREISEGIVGELASLGRSLRASSRSGLRAGCVIPVLLSGIAFYGLSTDTETGENLAGLALGGALVVGLPSMLRYMSLKSRLRRVEGLMEIWNVNSLKNGEEI